MKLEANDQKMLEKIKNYDTAWGRAIFRRLYVLAVQRGGEIHWEKDFSRFAHLEGWKKEEIDEEIIEWMLASYPAFSALGLCFSEEHNRQMEFARWTVRQQIFSKEVDEVLDKINAGIKRRDQNG